VACERHGKLQSAYSDDPTEPPGDGANPVENSKMLKKWVFAYVNKAAEGKDTLSWLMDYATPGFFDDSGTYDSSHGNMTKGEMDMFDQTLKYYMRNYSEGAVLDLVMDSTGDTNKDMFSEIVTAHFSV